MFEQAAEGGEEGDEAADEECDAEGSGEGGDDIESILALGGKCKNKGRENNFF